MGLKKEKIVMSDPVTGKEEVIECSEDVSALIQEHGFMGYMMKFVRGTYPLSDEELEEWERIKNKGEQDEYC